MPAVALEDRWSALVVPWAVKPVDAARAGRDVIQRYAEPHRRYHTTDHLASVLGALFLDLARDPVSVELAAFFHDAVYDPRAAEGANERASAELAVEVLTDLGAPAGTTSSVERLVMTTVDHRAAADDPDASVLSDADLSVLGAASPAYGAYAAAVRAEYGWLTDGEWRAGRAGVVRALLGRPWLFTTERGRQRWERTARANLSAELAALIAAR